MTPRVLSQRHFPGVGPGPLDDCGILATYMAVNAAAPWLDLPTVRVFREAAGAPDTDTGSEGTTEDHWYRGIAATWPELAPLCTKMSGWTWRQFLDEAKVRGRPAVLIVLSDLLPQNYGFTGPSSWHAVSTLHTGGMSWLAGNPLAEPHTWPDAIDQPTLRAAAEAYGAVHGVLMPTPAEAIALNPHVAALRETLELQDGTIRDLQRQITAKDAELAQLRADLTTCQVASADAFATGHAEGVTDGRRMEWDIQASGASVTLVPRP